MTKDEIPNFKFQIYNIADSIFSDVPGPPENFTVTTVTENSIGMRYDAPKDNGGSDITGYIIERREGTRLTWNATAEVTTMSYTAENLKEGQQYTFRVAAENEVGVGEFVEMPEAVTPKTAAGKMKIILLFIQ